MRIAMLVALVATPFVVSAAAAECSVARFRFFPGTEVGTSMTVSSGRECRITLRAHESSRFDKIEVVARPRHGTAAAGVGGAISYRSSPGYDGQDVFVFAVTGKMRTGNGTARIRVKVAVVDGALPPAAAATLPLPAQRSATATKKVAPLAADNVRRDCLRRHGAKRYDPQRRVWLLDMRYDNFFYDCLARKSGVAPSR